MIKENKVPCIAEGRVDCYLIQQGNKIGGIDWDYFYDPIDGFDYEPGFVYKLLVVKGSVKNPPQDVSTYRYRLSRVISKEVK
jgi:hypothetical protein